MCTPIDRRDFLGLLGLGAAALALPRWMRAAGPAFPLPEDAPIRPVPFTRVRFEDAFWRPRLETNRRVTIPYDFEKCEETGRIANFARAGGLEEGGFQGHRYNDSDVFKVIEGAAYALALEPDPELDAYLDGLIARIAAAQEPDGYLYTARTLSPTVDDLPRKTGAERWSSLSTSHELYNVGHLYEAAAAHYRATGKRTLLDVALANADLVAAVFGPDGRRDVPGHQEIEIGLVRLYGVTGEEKYLRLARFFLDERGRAHGRELYGEYRQDHEPVVEQDEAVGHAVRAGYMYAGMADVGSLAGEEAYARAIDRLWHDVVSAKLYLTGGIGARHAGEAFGEAYELPNMTAYNETCAAVANAMWNHRMFLLHGEAKYVDVLERVLYNGFLAGVSMDGDRFFYPNPLASDGEYEFNKGAAERKEWFGTSCCPVNVVRFVPSVPGYVYATRSDGVYVNLFVGGEGRVELGGREVVLSQQTRYPWDGEVRLTVEPREAATFALHLRIPGWAREEPVPGDLYRYTDEPSAAWTLAVNGKALSPRLVDGYAVIDRAWAPGDEVRLHLPMPVRRVEAHEAVEDDRGRVALERGPLVYCAEGADNDGEVLNRVLPDEAPLRAEHRDDLLGGVTVVTAPGQAVRRAAGPGARRTEDVDLTFVPYYAWNHRGANEMAVWLARTPDAVEQRSADAG